MTLEVSDDYALHAWLLGFGRLVRVVSPSGLADWIRRSWIRRASSMPAATRDGPTATFSPGCRSRSTSRRARERSRVVFFDTKDTKDTKVEP